MYREVVFLFLCPESKQQSFLQLFCRMLVKATKAVAG
jgi:hypothetical protein